MSKFIRLGSVSLDMEKITSIHLDDSNDVFKIFFLMDNGLTLGFIVKGRHFIEELERVLIDTLGLKIDYSDYIIRTMTKEDNG